MRENSMHVVPCERWAFGVIGYDGIITGARL